MIDILKNLRLTKKKVCIYFNRNETQKFNFGSFIAVNENEIAFENISPDGYYDGVSVINADMIYRVEINGQYVEKMNMLIDTNIEEKNYGDIDEQNILKSMLLYAEKNKNIVAFEFNNSGFFDVYGFVTLNNDGVCEIAQVDEYGFNDGVSFVSILDITQISLLSQQERRIEKLAISQQTKVTG